MRMLSVSLALGLVLLAQQPVHAQRRGRDGGEQAAVRNGWTFSLEDGKAQARQTGKPLMVVVRCVP